MLIVPARESRTKMVAAALAKASTENRVATDRHSGSAREAFETFGVL